MERWRKLIRSLSLLGKIYEEKNGNDIDTQLDDLKGEGWNVLLIEFQIDKEEIIYKGIDLEQYSRENKKRYMYKKGAPNGGDITPSSVYNKDDKKPLKSFNRYLLSLGKIDNSDFKVIDKYFEIEENKMQVFTDIEKMIQPKEKYLLSIKVNDKYLGDIQEVENKFESNGETRFSFMKSFPKAEQSSIGYDKKCYVCGKEHKQVNGFTSTFSFYTLDKPGFMTGGFNRKYAWKNYPVCSKCGDRLEKGRKYLEENLQDGFSGLAYFVIPNFVFNIDSDSSANTYKKIINSISQNKKISLGKENTGIMNREDRILNRVRDLDNDVNFTIMFYEQQNAMFRILENIEDIYPSRVRFLNIEKEKIENYKTYPEFKEFLLKKGEYKFFINFQILKHFFISDTLFLGTIHSVFADSKLDKNYIINLFINKIKEVTNSGEGIPEINVIESLMFLKFFRAINIFKNWEKGEIKTMVEKTEKNEIYLEFLERHHEVLDTDLKRGLFLEGLLTSKLLSLPEQRNQPFYSRINGLNINEKIAKRIFPEVINKLNEYGKGGYWLDLRELIAEYLLNSNFKSLTNDEMSYYFTLGLNLGRRLKENSEELEKIEEGGVK